MARLECLLLESISSSFNGQFRDSLVGPTVNQQVTNDLLKWLSLQSKANNGDDKEASTELVPGKTDLDAFAAFLHQHRTNIKQGCNKQKQR